MKEKEKRKREKKKREKKIKKKIKMKIALLEVLDKYVGISNKKLTLKEKRSARDLISDTIKSVLFKGLSAQK